MNTDTYKVCVRCFTFNHVSFIKETMDGFTMQQTSFPFVCVIIDDVSTDGELVVIKKYLQENFELYDKSVVKHEETDDYVLTFAQHKKNRNCFFAVYFLKYNHYSVNKTKWIYIPKWTDDASYHAICEGDDYWTDPRKLQIQFDYMESHPECTMTCHRAQLYSEKKHKHIGEQYCRNSDGVLNPVEIINRTGLYIPTCSLMYRPLIRDNYPEYCQNCKVSDYPLQITAAMKGSVYYFNKCMSVYRIGNSASWIGRQQHESVDPARLKVVCGQKEMFEGFAKDYPKYRKVIQDKISEHILRNMPKPRGGNNNDMLVYQELFSKEFSNLTLKWKFYYLACKSRIPHVKKWYYKIVLNNYTPNRLIYGSQINRLINYLKMVQ